MNEFIYEFETVIFNAYLNLVPRQNIFPLILARWVRSAPEQETQAAPRGAPGPAGRQGHGCQMAIDRFVDFMFFASFLELRASGL